MAIFEEFEKKLQADPKSIVFTEGTDARILSAASKLLAAKTLKVILLGEAEAVKKAAADGGFDITGAELLDPKNYDGMDEMAAKMVELRKGKMTDEQLVHYVEDRVEKARSEGFNQGKAQSRPTPKIDIQSLVDEIGMVKGIGAGKLADIKTILLKRLAGEVNG